MTIHWRYMDISTLPQTGMLDVRIGFATKRRWLATSIRLMRRVAVDNPLAVEFVRKSTYALRFIVHPNGGNAMQIVCDECGAAYPFNWTMPKLVPCAFCAVRRQSGVQVRLSKWSWQRLLEV